MPVPKRGVAYTLNRGLFSVATPGTFQVNPTIAAGDFQVSQDGGAFANLTNLPTVSPAGSRQVQIVLTATEMTADRVTIQAVDQAGNEWGELLESFDTTLQTVDDLATQASVNTLDDFVDTEVAAILAAVDTEVAAIKAQTDNLPPVPAAVGSAMTLTTGERDSVADALLNRDLSVGTDSGSTTVRTVRQALRFLRNKWTLVTSTLTVYKEDDTTASWTATVAGTAGADPVTSVDPAGP